MILQFIKLGENMQLLDSQKKVSLTELKNKGSIKMNHLMEQKIVIKLFKYPFISYFETRI